MLLQRAPHATGSTASSSASAAVAVATPAPAPVAPVTTTTWNGLTSPREGLPRFPSASATGLVRLLDYAGTVAFSASGALTALGCGCDLFGACAIGIITSCGGGTWRDVIVYRCQPFWFEEWEYLVLALLGAGGIFLAWEHLEPAPVAPTSFWQGFTLKSASGGEGVAMEWADHVAFGAFAVIGSMGAIRNQAPLLVVPICATMTCTFGGLTRDTLLNRPVRILYGRYRS